MTGVDICMCTFRRPQVTETLRSIALLELPEGVTVRVIVADNEETPAAKEIVEGAARETGLDILYIHAPARNISIARNACLDAATAPFIAFVDDDETATPGWIAALLRSIEDADVALGTVEAIYAGDAPAWIVSEDYHSTRPTMPEGRGVPEWSTANVMLRRLSPAVEGLRFRLEMGRSGGEDTMYFMEIRKRGGRFALAPGAVVTEIVPPARSRFGWLLKRRFRSGQTHGVLLLEEGVARPRALMTAGLKAAFCLGMAAVCFRRWRFWILRGALHAGVVSRLLGKKEIVQYGQQEAGA